MKKPETVDEYIGAFPAETQVVLETLRLVIRKAVPKGEECISYGVACMKLGGKFVIYFAGYKSHVSLYPAPRAVPEFKKELSAYKGGKGTVQFSLDKKLPMTLIKRIIKYRLEDNQERTKKTKK